MLRISKYFWTDFRKLFMLEIVKKKKKKKPCTRNKLKKNRNVVPTLSNVWQDKIISAVFLTLKEQQFLEGVNIQMDSQFSKFSLKRTVMIWTFHHWKQENYFPLGTTTEHSKWTALFIQLHTRNGKLLPIVWLKEFWQDLRFTKHLSLYI